LPLSLKMMFCVWSVFYGRQCI